MNHVTTCSNRLSASNLISVACRLVFELALLDGKYLDGLIFERQINDRFLFTLGVAKITEGSFICLSMKSEMFLCSARLIIALH